MLEDLMLYHCRFFCRYKLGSGQTAEKNHHDDEITSA